MIKVALIRIAIPMRRYHSTEEHLGLGYLAGYLRARNIHYILIDMPAMNTDHDAALAQLVTNSPPIIGFTIDYANESETGRFLARVRQVLPKSFLIAGGHHATLDAEQLLLRRPELDAIVLGEGEVTLYKIWKAYIEGSQFDTVPGLVIRTHKGIIRTCGVVEIPSISTLPHPARDALRSQIMNGNLPVARVISARGCPGRCSFCTSPPFLSILGAGEWRPRDPEDVVMEIINLKNEFNIGMVIFSEDNSLGWGRQGHARFLRIAELLRDNKVYVKFRIMGRVDNFRDNPEDEYFLRLLKSAGLQRIYLGLDGGSTKSLETYNKNVHVQRIFETKRLLDRLNISIGVGFINFHPYSTFEELAVNCHFLETTGFGVNFDHFASSLELYPGIRIIKKLNKDGLLGPINKKTGLREYLFQDNRLGGLLRFLEDMRNKLFEVDSFAWRLLHMKQNLREWLEEIEEPKSTYIPYKISIAKCAADLTKCHASAFRDYLRIAEITPCDTRLFQERSYLHVKEAWSAIKSFQPVLRELICLIDHINAPGKYDQRSIVYKLVNLLEGHCQFLSALNDDKAI